MNSRLQVGLALGVVVALSWIGACSGDNRIGPPAETPPPKGMLVSHPEPLTSLARSSGSLSSLEGDELVYVSVYPGSVRGAAQVTFQNPTARFTLVAAASDGGIDPVPVPALPGDSVIVVVTDSSGQSVRFGEEVRANRPPIVIRTEPPHKKTDVPVNAALVVVFSEPMDSATITSQSIQLLANGQATGAQVALAADHLRALIAPNGGLASNTTYTLAVTTSVKDLTGLPLAQRAEVDFTTGSSSSYGISVTVSPSAATVPVGSVLQLTATVRDIHGNATGPAFRPVQWTIECCGTAVALSPSGLVRALQPGRSTITVFADSGTGSAVIDVVPAASLDVGGVWDWTETIVDPGVTTCSDTGSYVFTQTGSAFTGTSRQVGVCGTTDNTRIDPVTAGAAGGNSLSFEVGGVGGCSYAATVTTGAPDHLSGTVSCGTTATGTWAAHRPQPLASVAVAPPGSPVIDGDTVWIRAALRDGAGNRVFFRPVSWASSNQAVATVLGTADSAMLVATGPGPATITASAEGKSGTMGITVGAAGTIRTTTTTTGVDLDPEGYAVDVDGGPRTPIPTNGTVSMTPFKAGTHSVRLTGIADNCTVAEPNPSAVSVTLAETTTVAFTITCTAAGSIRVTTISTGVDVPSGYSVSVDGGTFQQVIGANAQLTFAPLGARSHTVVLGVPFHCTVSGANPVTVAVTAGSTADVTFQVTCAAVGHIAFYSPQGFVTINGDGSGAVPFPIAGYQAAWSPNGSRLAFEPFATTCAGAPSQSVVCVMNADGTGIMGLPISATPAQNGLSWSPDGSKIAFFGAGGLYTVNVDGSGSILLTSSLGVGSPNFPAWSPDGSKIAFSCGVESGNSDICVVNADGTGLTRLTTDPADDHRPSWKPDGSQIAFATTRYGLDGNGNPTIAVMNADGSGVTRIGNGDAPAWSPDGGRIAFLYQNCVDIGDCELWLMVMRADGTGSQFLSAAVYIGDTPAWRP